MRPRTAFLVLLLASIAMYGCNQDEDDPDDEDEASYQTSISLRYVTAFDDGLYCLGSDRGGGGPPVLLPAPEPWLPWPFVEGVTLQGSPCGFIGSIVQDTEAMLDTQLGTFTGVVVLNAWYGRPGDWFKEDLGFLRHEGMGTHDHVTQAITSLRVSPGDDVLANRFGIAVGNEWRFSVNGADSLGYSYTGELVRTVTGIADVSGYPAYVLEDVRRTRYLGRSRPLHARLVP